MRINAIVKTDEYNEQRRFNDEDDCKQSKQNDFDVHISFSEILKKVKHSTY